MTRIGTSHFVTRQHANRYYANYGLSKADVMAKLDAGEIALGPPEYSDNERLEVDADGRYQIIAEQTNDFTT